MDFLDGLIWGLGFMMLLIVAAVALVGFITVGVIMLQRLVDWIRSR